MRGIGRRFRFTIGQGMVVIALLAVAFAIMPMPAAIVLTFATTGLIALGRRRLPKPTMLSELIVGVFGFFGMVGGVAVGRWWGVDASYDRWIDNEGFCALGGILIGVVAGRLLGAALWRPPILTDLAFDPEHAETRAELKLVAYLLRQAHEDGDEVTILKLTEYRAKLEHELEAWMSDP